MSDKSTAFSKFQCGNLTLDMERPQIMGILNLTEDSFYDGGTYTSVEKYMERAEQMIQQGAAIIDVGAASTRPGAKLIDEDTEWSMLENALIKLRKEFPNKIISVDTYHAAQVKKCANLGVNIINDISGGSWDEQMFREIAQYKMAYVMMHIQGKPQNMQKAPCYPSLMNDILSYFEEGIQKLQSLNFNQIIIDPGFGFGKTLEDNFQLLAQMDTFHKLRFPILAGLSRKSMVFRALGVSPAEALNGTTALHMLALINGARILRVHDVKEANETIRLFSMYKEGEEKN